MSLAIAEFVHIFGQGHAAVHIPKETGHLQNASKLDGLQGSELSDIYQERLASRVAVDLAEDFDLMLKVPRDGGQHGFLEAAGHGPVCHRRPYAKFMAVMHGYRVKTAANGAKAHSARRNE